MPSVTQVAAAATTFLDAASAVLDKALTPTQLSLTQYTKPTTALSRVYIDGTVASEPVLPDLIRSLHVAYCGLIINAIHLNTLVTGGKTVREMLNVVATEADEPYVDIGAEFQAMEAYHVRDPDEMASDDVMASVSLAYMKNQMGQKPKDGKSAAVSDITPAPTGLVPVGRTIQVTLTNPDNERASVQVALTIQMAPYIVPGAFAYELIGLNAQPSFSQRVMQWKAGELSFFRDLILGIDLTEKRAAMIRADKDGTLADFFAHQVRKDVATTKNTLRHLAGKSVSHNIANSVLVFSEETVLKAKAEYNFDIHRSGDRARYFQTVYAMIIAVINQEFGRVTLYFNGIDVGGTYHFQDFKTSKGDSALDLLKALNDIGKGRAPRI